MKNYFLMMCTLTVFQSLVVAQNAVLYESKNVIVKSKYSSLVVGEKTSIFYEVTTKEFSEVVPVVHENGKLIDSLQSPISIVANKGPYVCLVFLFRKENKAPWEGEVVWIPVTANHNTVLRITNRRMFFEKEGEVNSNGDLLITPLIGTNTSHCKGVYVNEMKASLVSGGTIKFTETTYKSGYVEMARMRYMASEGDMISVKVTKMTCIRPDDTVSIISLPFEDTYVKAKFTSVRTLWNSLNK